MDKYIYRGAPETRVFGPLSPGDYNFVVTGADQPYFKNDKWILPLKLTIQPQGLAVFTNPWSGIDRNGEDRDGIAEFLLAVNRAPASGEQPDWGRLIGAKGRCRLKVEIAQVGQLAGKQVNKVAFFHRPKQLGPTLPEPGAKSGLTKSAADPALEVEPDDIPF